MSDLNKIKAMRLKLKNGKPSKDFNPNWIKERFTDDTINFTEDLGFLICDKQIFVKKDGTEGEENGKNSVTNSQIRNFFGEVKRIQLKLSGDAKKWPTQNTAFLLLRPKLNYMAARVLSKNGNSRITLLKNALETALLSIEVAPEYTETSKQFIRFSEFLEAILAYHKSFGGKE